MKQQKKKKKLSQLLALQLKRQDLRRDLIHEIAIVRYEQHGTRKVRERGLQDVAAGRTFSHDDVFSELDDHHREKLLSALGNYQVILTSTHLPPMPVPAAVWRMDAKGMHVPAEGEARNGRPAAARKAKA